jgi:ferredoxin
MDSLPASADDGRTAGRPDGPTDRRTDGPTSEDWRMTLVTADEVKAKAADLGFIACGITDLQPSAYAQELDEWLRRGYGGTMRYLNRQAAKRRDPRKVDPAARRVVVVLDNYYCSDYSPGADGAPRVARYASSKDYHHVTLNRINSLADFLIGHGAKAARSYVDTGPVPERELAQRAGLGWIGKNTMLLRPGVGSWFFIGTVFTDLPLQIDSPFVSDHCGSCTRCLDACPTSAFVEPHLLDATKCISYLTIEWKKELPAELAGSTDGHSAAISATRFALEPAIRRGYQIEEFRPKDPPGADRPTHAMTDEERPAIRDTPSPGRALSSCGAIGATPSRPCMRLRPAWPTVASRGIRARRAPAAPCP